jgi:hypothetical protein
MSFQELHYLSLLLARESITFKMPGGESTIDLDFSSSDLINTLTACCLIADLDHGSDHYHTETSLLSSPHVSPHVPKPLCRKAGWAELSLRARELDLLPRRYKNCKDINAGVDRLVRWNQRGSGPTNSLVKTCFFFCSLVVQ